MIKQRFEMSSDGMSHGREMDRSRTRLQTSKHVSPATDSLWARETIGYITARQNCDGGYTFCQYTVSNAQDTFFALGILKLLDSSFPNVQLTIKWLREFPCYSLRSHYYVAKALGVLGKERKTELRKLVRGSELLFETFDFYVAVASEFETAFMITELINIGKIRVGHEKAVNQLLRYRNADGGFGIRGWSNLNSTYHAVSSLFNLGYHVSSLKNTVRYVKSCEKSSGGFTMTPSSSPPHMEHTYYGVSTLDLLGKSPQYPQRVARFVHMCQQGNGGFARAEFGISTFEDTFYAVNVLRKIDRLKNQAAKPFRFKLGRRRR